MATVMVTTQEMFEVIKARIEMSEIKNCSMSGSSTSSNKHIEIGTDAYDDLRTAPPEELLAAVEWFTRQSIKEPWQLKQVLSFLREGFDLARPGGWERVAPMWLRESKKLAALDQ